MDKLIDIINNAITITEADQPHIVNIPELKRALLVIAEHIERLETQKTRYDKWIESKIDKSET